MTTTGNTADPIPPGIMLPDPSAAPADVAPVVEVTYP